MPPRTFFAIIMIVLMLGLGQFPLACQHDYEISESTSSTHDKTPRYRIPDGTTERVSISFQHELTPKEVEQFEVLGISFGADLRHIGAIYIVEASDDALERLASDPLFIRIEPLKTQHYYSPRDVSIVETRADLAWAMEDLTGDNLTGEGILIADLDTGIQWRHPDFFHADGGSFVWFDQNSNSQFDNGTDGIDLNGDGSITSNETLYTIDTNNNGIFETDIDWIWLDNGTSIGAIDDGDTFFVISDTNSNGVLNVGEYLIALYTPKTKYIVETNGFYPIVWERGVNLTSSTHYDTHGHGTGVAGILNGGQLGYRRFVGVAPDAEVMAINIFGAFGLTVEDALIWAYDHGADIILIEIGSWSYEFLDGSSNVEMMIDSLTHKGIPVIVPAGNLCGGGRHAMRNGFSGVPLSTRFSVPSSLGITELYLTVLCNQPVSQAMIDIIEPTSTGFIAHHLNPGVGYNNWVMSPATLNITVQSFIATSIKGTHMIAVHIMGSIKDTLYWSIDINNPNTAGYHFYIADDVTSWSGGVSWHPSDGLSDSFTITWPSTADTAISVASYMSRNLWAPGYGNIAPYSSSGPRIDGIQKMSVAAPGGWDIVSPWSSDAVWATWMTGAGGLPLYPMFGGYQLFSGTSAAGPHVAGAVALMLQLNKDCGSMAKVIIEATTYTDGYTGSITPFPAPADPRWGYGKLDVQQAIIETLNLPVVNNINRTPDSPQYFDAVTITANITNVDYVEFQWTNNGWYNITLTNMTLSEGIYSISLPFHNYGTNVEFWIMATNISAIGSLNLYDSYTVDDRILPILTSVSSNVTVIMYDSTFVEVNASASEPLGASGLASVVIEVTFNNWQTVNVVPMTGSSGQYTGIIIPAPVGVTVKFHVKATDNAGNIAVSSDYSYVPQASSTTTTSTTTTFTTTTSTGIIDFLLDNIVIVVGVTLVLLLILIIVLRRRP